MEILPPRVAPFGLPIQASDVQDVWNVFVKPNQGPMSDIQSVEMRVLMAILRSVYAGLLPKEES